MSSDENSPSKEDGRRRHGKSAKKLTNGKSAPPLSFHADRNDCLMPPVDEGNKGRPDSHSLSDSSGSSREEDRSKRYNRDRSESTERRKRKRKKSSSSHKLRKEKKKAEEERKEERARRKEKKEKKKKKKEKQEKKSKVDSDSNSDSSDDPNVRRSVITGKRIKMNLDRSNEDHARERGRKELLQFMNAQF